MGFTRHITAFRAGIGVGHLIGFLCPGGHLGRAVIGLLAAFLGRAPQQFFAAIGARNAEGSAAFDALRRLGAIPEHVFEQAKPSARPQNCSTAIPHGTCLAAKHPKRNQRHNRTADTAPDRCCLPNRGLHRLLFCRKSRHTIPHF